MNATPHRVGPKQAKLLELIRRSSNGYIESPSDLPSLRALERRGLVEVRRGYWFLTEAAP